MREAGGLGPVGKRDDVDDLAVAADECAALAAAWPRPLIAEGLAEGLAAWWLAERARARAAGAPPIPRHALSKALADGLFEARRARRLERGLEGAESLLAAEEAGLSQAAATRAGGAGRRISRLLIVSNDGSERFYRDVARVHTRFADRLEVLLLEADENELGAAAFGPGRHARALLLQHKEAVVRFLWLLETRPAGD